MRIVFSRKGFDSQYGRVASPILPDGSMFSLPIPSAEDPHCLGDLRPRGFDVAGIVGDLSVGALTASTRVHLDPDLDQSCIPRTAGWRASFGQTSAAQSHLNGQGVGPGDLFLFFGWFRRVERVGGKWRFERKAPDVHVLFGWLQVEEAILVGQDPKPTVARFPWLAEHPHVAGAAHYSGNNNTVYVARERVRFGRRDFDLPGGGAFSTFRSVLQLTAPGRSRSWWRLPKWFTPEDGRPPLSYHSAPSRWTPGGDHVVLRVVDKGQEFVLNTERYPDAESWVVRLLTGH